TGTFDDQTDGTFGNCDGNCAPFFNQGLFLKSGGTGTTRSCGRQLGNRGKRGSFANATEGQICQRDTQSRMPPGLESRTFCRANRDSMAEWPRTIDCSSMRFCTSLDPVFLGVTCPSASASGIASGTASIAGPLGVSGPR